MISGEQAIDLARGEAVEALPAVSALRRPAMTTFPPGDPESDELARMLEACVVGAHRLRLREQLRSGNA